MSLLNDIEAVGKTLRLVVMMEVRPLSDEYEQIELTHVQYKELTDMVYRMQKPFGDHVIVKTVGDTIQIPNVRQHV